MSSERFIENNVIRNRAQFGYSDSVYIRRCRVGQSFGIVDVAIMPLRGPHRLVLIEAKQGESQDSNAKVIGQLLLYYAGALRLGARGIRLLRQFATAHPHSARSTKPKSLKMLSGGFSPPENAWKELQKGRKLQPHQIGLFIALDNEPSDSLKSTLSVLEAKHDLKIGVISVLGRDNLEIKDKTI